MHKAKIYSTMTVFALTACGGDLNRTMRAIDTLGYSEYQISSLNKASKAFHTCEVDTMAVAMVECQNRIVRDTFPNTPNLILALIKREEIAHKIDNNEIRREEGLLALKKPIVEALQQDASQSAMYQQHYQQPVIQNEHSPYVQQPYIMPISHQSLQTHCSSYMVGNQTNIDCN